MTESDTKFRLPQNDQRCLIVGRTGSGKTQLGTWLLSLTDFDKRPWIIIDYKGDRLLNSTEVIPEIEPTSKPPKKPGLYIMHPLPHETEEVESFLWACWEKGNIGIYIDEGYMIPNGKALRALLTQGRSKHIPMIILSQRPVEIDRFAISEADYYFIFRLNDKLDRQSVGRFVDPQLMRYADKRLLPEFHSAWYDVAKDNALILEPVPAQDEIIERIERRSRPGKTTWL